ncbi:hypothetical protein Pfo_021725 [Paulownia fortunei]|nr:hypothetical protein Pfo_021725 [Paulownia fortunei]
MSSYNLGLAELYAVKKLYKGKMVENKEIREACHQITDDKKKKLPSPSGGCFSMVSHKIQPSAHAPAPSQAKDEANKGYGISIYEGNSF